MLSTDEAHHATRVLRAKVDSRCCAFDGLGHEAECRIAAVSRSAVELEILVYRKAPNELPGWISIAVGMPKGDRQKSIIEKGVELGIHELVPLVCERSVCRPSEMSVDRWNRTNIEACKQSERNQLLRIRAPRTFKEWISADTASDPEESDRGDAPPLRWIAHPDRANSDRFFFGIHRKIASPYRTVLIAIGPEGGFSDDEVAFARSLGWQTISFGTRILRVETAFSLAGILGSLVVGRDESR